MPPVPPSSADVPTDATGTWRATATDADKERVRGWYSGWQAALADARAKGFGADIDREGLLLQPAAALPNPHLPAGDYRCRTIKIGAQGRSSLSYVAYGWFRCRGAPEQGLSSLTKISGSQRPVGLIFPDNLKRQIFLGTLELGDEKMAVNYGSDRMRDMAGLVERIGDNRWRLVLPAPAYESLLDVIELVPAS
ncbi:mlr1235 protein [Sphingopyxis sp. C-1]|nr:mlr1235 protein [Sphingopyxis sp. C-1]